MKLLPLFLVFAGASALAVDANRLTYLDDSSPFWPGPKSAKLTTPQWIGEKGVDAVVVLAIDDMRDPAKYETPAEHPQTSFLHINLAKTWLMGG